ANASRTDGGGGVLVIEVSVRRLSAAPATASLSEGRPSGLSLDGDRDPDIWRHLRLPGNRPMFLANRITRGAHRYASPESSGANVELLKRDLPHSWMESEKSLRSCAP